MTSGSFDSFIEKSGSTISRIFTDRAIQSSCFLSDGGFAVIKEKGKAGTGGFWLVHNSCWVIEFG